MAKPAGKPTDMMVVADHVGEDRKVPEVVSRFDAEQGVGRLLLQDSELVAVVSEAASQVVRYIPDARLTLELLTDPEYDSGEQLLLGIATDLEEDDASEALQRFDRQWWVHHVGRAQGLLCIDLGATTSEALPSIARQGRPDSGRLDSLVTADQSSPE